MVAIEDTCNAHFLAFQEIMVKSKCSKYYCTAQLKRSIYLKHHMQQIWMIANHVSAVISLQKFWVLMQAIQHLHKIKKPFPIIFLPSGPLSLLILSLLYFPRPCYLLHFSVLAQASFIISLSLCFISFLLFTHFEDTLWGIYYIHEAARIQFYSFDETVRNFTLNFLHLTFSQKSPSVLAPCDSSVWTHCCQFHGSQRLDRHKKNNTMRWNALPPAFQ